MCLWALPHALCTGCSGCGVVVGVARRGAVCGGDLMLLLLCAPQTSGRPRFCCAPPTKHTAPTQPMQGATSTAGFIMAEADMGDEMSAADLKVGVRGVMMFCAKQLVVVGGGGGGGTDGKAGHASCLSLLLAASQPSSNRALAFQRGPRASLPEEPTPACRALTPPHTHPTPL